MDLAKIGFKADTADLDKASLKLEKVKAAAAGMTAGTTAAGKAVQTASVAVAAAKTSEANAIYKAIMAQKNATKTDRDAAKASLAAAQAEETKARAMVKATAAAEAVARATRAASAANTAFNASAGQRGRVSAAATGVTPFSGMSGSGPARDQMPNRFNTGNIAAQFQDIGVTAAMGMNPLTIALQQGTQLSAILNTMESPLKGIAIAFRSILNPVALLSIGLVGLAAAFIQVVDWVDVAKNGLYFLADAVENIGPYILGAVGFLALLYAPSIIAGLYTLVKAIAVIGLTALKTGAQIAYAWVLANPITALAGVVVAAGILATQMFKPFRDVVNNIIGLFVGAFNGIKESWSNLPAALGDLIYQAANKVLEGVEAMVNGTINLLKKIPGLGSLSNANFDSINNPFAGSASDAGAIFTSEMDKALRNVDYVGIIGTGIQTATQKASGLIRKYADGIGTGAGEGKGKTGSKGETEGDKFEDIVKGAQRRLAVFEAERAAIGKSAFETARLKHETDLLNEAQQKNIKLTPEMRAQLEGLATTLASAEIASERTKEAFNFAKDAARGFFQDMKQGLQDGKGLWESFGNAVVNVLNKIFDKMIENGVEGMFEGLGAMAGGGGGGGWLSSLGSLLFSAKGNAFNGGGVQPFAKGGSFTNGVYNNPTLFAFANGGQFGVMGEKGPEAVMPLHRGADGSLGVKNSGGGSGVVVIVNDNSTKATSNVKQRQTQNGVEIEVMIDDIVGEKLSQPGTTTNRALNTHNSRQLVKR